MIDKRFTITEAAGGVKPKNFTPPIPGFQTKPSVIITKATLQVLQKTFINTGSEETDSTEIFSPLNTPVYSDITFEGGQYIDDNGNNVSFVSVNVQLAIIFMTNQKNIIETQLQGRDGTVKEYISSGDYQIRIEGRVFGKGANNYPIDEVQNLIAICDAPQAITVTSDYLKMFNVTSIVIKQADFDQVEGERNYQHFKLTCVSDRELILLKNA